MFCWGGRIHTASHTGTTVALIMNHQELLHLEKMTLVVARIYRRATYFQGYKISWIGGQIFEDEQVMSYRTSRVYYFEDKYFQGL